MRPLITIALVLVSAVQAIAGPTEQETAAEVDRLLERHFENAGVSVAPLVNDEDFLRRVWLDLAGKVPSPRDVTMFGLNPAAGKRAEVVDVLLSSEDFSEIWSAYWKDVIFLRATEQRARRVQPVFQSWMKDQLRSNRSWGEITRSLITATGPVGEAGETGLIYAHTGQPEELAAEVSRIFLGIQMSCANCHNHPTDAWTREQFHQLAAYFPRVTVRPETPGDQRSFAVRSLEGTPGRGGGPPDPERTFSLLDLNRDGQLTRNEAARGPFAQRFELLLATADANKDGQISKQEFLSALTVVNQQPGRGAAEHYMPDLDNPAARGTLMQPVFFISDVRGPRVRGGADDLTRRQALAESITSPENPWFARAFVNRIWAELLGQGFYMPIDDIGPERIPQFEDVLNVLARGFTDNDYDIQWLYRTIVNTRAYQRQLAASAAPPVPFAAATPTRLRSDQIYNSLVSILGVPPTGGGGRGFMAGGPRGVGGDPGRVAFAELFGFDPSTPQEDLLGNVPQALFLMNSGQIEAALGSSGQTRLSRILRKHDDDRDALHELYLLVLSRGPIDEELNIHETYLRDVGNRSEAFEDIFWSLLNSAEFLTKR